MEIQGCASSLTSQPNVVLGASPTYSLTATETNAQGFTLTFCYECKINPTGQSAIYFSLDPFRIKSDPLDCSTSLVKVAGFGTPPVIAFNSANIV